MNLLINEPPLQVLPTLALKIGLNEAIVFQQIHYWTRVSKNKKDGHLWVYKTFKEWEKEFPFWSLRTIQRIIKNLEEKELIFSSKTHNRAAYDRTKWYRINYEKLKEVESDILSQCKVTECHNPTRQNDVIQDDNLSECITREYTENTTEIKKDADASIQEVVKIVVDYLNQKTGAKYRPQTAATQKLVKARLKEGFTVSDFQKVIDVKTKEWTNTKYAKHLTPNTLFGNKFEGYLQQSNFANKNQEKEEVKLPQNANKPFDFGE